MRTARRQPWVGCEGRGHHDSAATPYPKIPACAAPARKRSVPLSCPTRSPEKLRGVLKASGAWRRLRAGIFEAVMLAQMLGSQVMQNRTWRIRHVGKAKQHDVRCFRRPRQYSSPVGCTMTGSGPRESAPARHRWRQGDRWAHRGTSDARDDPHETDAPEHQKNGSPAHVRQQCIHREVVRAADA